MNLKIRFTEINKQTIKTYKNKGIRYMKNRIISDLCGNKYYIEETKDIEGVYLEVSEIVNVDGKEMKTYLCDVGQPFSASDDEILDDIDDLKSKFIKE